MIKKSSHSNHAKDLVTVIIPTFNAQERLLLLLKSLKNQSIQNFEVVVVDDGSTDGTRGAVKKSMAGYPVSLRYYYLDNSDIFGAGIARNRGSKHAKGNILLFLDQDCVAEKDLIKKHVDHHKTKNIILGYYAGYGDEKRCYQFSKLKDYVQQGKSIPAIKDFRDQLFIDAPHNEAWKYFVSAHFSIKKEIFKEANFDESFIQWGCEDIDLGYRLFQAGETIHFVKECVVYNSSESPRRTKAKFRSLAKSLIHMYKKYQTQDMKLYCLERFYHVPLKYRDSLQVIFKNNAFEIQETQTKILIDEKFCAQVVLGPDFPAVASTIEDIIPLIKKIHFDISIIKTLEESLLIDFRNIFHRLIKVLRDKKININLEDIRKQSFLMGVRFIGPKKLSIEFYNKCNVTCLFCSINTPLMKNTKNVPRSLDFSLLEKILDQAYETGVQAIRLLSDGEPLLSPDIFAVLDSIANKGFALNFLTNATVLNKKHLFLFNRICSLSLLVNFSAAKKTTYQKIYGGNPKNYDFVLRSLSWLSGLRHKKRMRNENIHIATTYIITNLNYSEISEYVLLVKRLNVDYVYFKFAILYEEAEVLLLNKEQRKELRKEVIKAMTFAAKLSLPTSLDEVLKNIDDEGFQDKNDIKQHSLNLPVKNCYNGWFFARVTSSGKYYICCRDTVHFGNVHKKEFKDIFFSHEITDILKEGASGSSLEKRMWSKCNYCYHLQTNKMAGEWLANHEDPHTCD